MGGRGSIMTTGLIFDIKEFAINDGPGIRLTVFMKGCRCVAPGVTTRKGFRRSRSTTEKPAVWSERNTRSKN